MDRRSCTAPARRVGRRAAAVSCSRRPPPFFFWHYSAACAGCIACSTLPPCLPCLRPRAEAGGEGGVGRRGGGRCDALSAAPLRHGLAPRSLRGPLQCVNFLDLAPTDADPPLCPAGVGWRVTGPPAAPRCRLGLHAPRRWRPSKVDTGGLPPAYAGRPRRTALPARSTARQRRHARPRRPRAAARRRPPACGGGGAHGGRGGAAGWRRRAASPVRRPRRRGGALGWSRWPAMSAGR